jgi:hypothetical protein
MSESPSSSDYRDSDSYSDSDNESIFSVVNDNDTSGVMAELFNSPTSPSEEQKRMAFQEALLEQYNNYIDNFYALKDLSKLILARINNEDPISQEELDERNKLSETNKNRLVDYYTDMLKDINKYEELLSNFNNLDNILIKHKGAYRLASTFSKSEVPTSAAIQTAFDFLKSKGLSPKESLYKRQLLGSGKRSAKKSTKRKQRKSKSKKQRKSSKR